MHRLYLSGGFKTQRHNWPCQCQRAICRNRGARGNDSSGQCRWRRPSRRAACDKRTPRSATLRPASRQQHAGCQTQSFQMFIHRLQTD